MQFAPDEMRSKMQASAAAQGLSAGLQAIEPKSGRLTQLVSRLEGNNERLNAITVQITEFANRLGAERDTEPEAIARDTEPEPVGLVHQLEGRFARASIILDALEQAAQRLDTVA